MEVILGVFLLIAQADKMDQEVGQLRLAALIFIPIYMWAMTLHVEALVAILLVLVHLVMIVVAQADLKQANIPP